MKKNNNNIILKSEINKNTGLRYIYIKINNNIGTIENISKSTIYSGSEYLMLSLQILYLLNEECIIILIDYNLSQKNFYHNYYYF